MKFNDRKFAKGCLAFSTVAICLAGAFDFINGHNVSGALAVLAGLSGLASMLTGAFDEN